MNFAEPNLHLGEEAHDRHGALTSSGHSGRPILSFAAVTASSQCLLSIAGGHAQVRVHTREGSLRPVTDVTLEREGAQWPPELTSAERADIMRPEALRSDRQLLSAAAPGRAQAAPAGERLDTLCCGLWGGSRGGAHAQLPGGAVQPPASSCMESI